MAIACFLLVTFLPLLPLCNLPFFLAFISVSTLLLADFEYLRFDDFLALDFFVVVNPLPLGWFARSVCCIEVRYRPIRSLFGVNTLSGSVCTAIRLHKPSSRIRIGSFHKRPNEEHHMAEEVARTTCLPLPDRRLRVTSCSNKPR